MIIGLSGKIGSGKSTVSEIFKQNGFELDSFAKSVKDVVNIIFGFDREKLEGINKEDRIWREKSDKRYSELLGKDFSPREAMILIGTTIGRNIIHQDIWIASLEKKINPNVNYVIPDTRFPNEINLINKISGEIWCVKRGKDPSWFTQYQMGGSPPNDIHSSEWEWARSKFDKVVENNGTLEDLTNSVLNVIM